VSPSDLAGEAGVRSKAPTAVPRLRSLTAKQALATLVIVFLLSLTGAAYELVDTWRNTRGEATDMVNRTANLVDSVAVEAAYLLSPRLAGNVVGNLTDIDVIAGVRLQSNFGEVLAAGGREIDAPDTDDDIAQALFGDITRHSFPLVRVQDGERSEVGQLEVRLSTAHLASDFYAHALRNMGVGFLRALGTCALVVAVFYVIITRPLLNISRAIGQVDPTRPAAVEIPTPRLHGSDELGLLVGNLNQLLRAFQDGLDRRDAAERELTALNRDLEARVAERTRALEHANEELTREKSETERAFRELEKIHHELQEANQQILDSLHYAQRIQSAALPDTTDVQQSVRDLHLWWEPLQEVGGDYVWMERIDGKCLILLADCTGHGVPGAFMTLITAAAVDRVVHDRGLREPSDILVALDHMVRRRLRQDRSETRSDDGLEAAACLFDPEAGTLTFAGAGLPLIYAQDGEVREIRGDRTFLGYRTLPRPESVTQHTLRVEPGTSIYLLTDGVTDQMGVEAGRLFGRGRLRRELSSVQDRPIGDQVAHVQATLRAYAGESGKRDDVTLLAIALPGPSSEGRLQ
jgi:serine phosphatase RsbU (regulator of sigma subunit)